VRWADSGLLSCFYTPGGVTSFWTGDEVVGALLTVFQFLYAWRRDFVLDGGVCAADATTGDQFVSIRLAA